MDPSAQCAPDDTALLDEALQGRSEAFGALMERHRDMLFHGLLRFLGHREEAEDVLQQVYIEAYRHLSSFRRDSRFSSWLYAIALNRARNRLRHLKSKPTIPLEGHPVDEETPPVQIADHAPGPDVVAEHQSEEEWVDACIAQLPEDYREIFTLRYRQDLPLQEIARLLGRPLGTIKVYLHRARKELHAQWLRTKRPL